MKRGPIGVVACLIALLLPVESAGAAPAIEFLNPSDYQTTLTMSDVPDADSAYHLVTWVQQVPASPIVEIEIQPAAGPITTIDATRVGTDTWEAFISLASFSDGQYTLRALLFSGQQDVASIEKMVTINRDDPLAPGVETAEIFYPENGGALGFFTPKGGRPATVIDARASEDALRVRALYTLSDPGNDPEWVACGSASPDANGFARAGCTLAEGHNPLEVTAVAVVANQTSPPVPPQTQADQSGDAHRVLPYASRTNAVEISPASTTLDPNTCGEFTATVTDQNARPILAANVDLHAVGPNDQLRFGEIEGTTDGYQNPDSAHVSSELSFDCPEDDRPARTPPRQGDHNVPGQNDTKHIESVAGTDVNGTFVFSLHSETVGATEVLAWGDDDGDNLPDTSEAAAGAGIGWGQPPPVLQPTIVLDPESSSATTGTCARFTLVTRRGGTPIANANVDLHITGPDASVAFCNPGDGGATRAPDSGGHLGDAHTDGTRHAEGETSSNGTFVFGVTSATEGTTQILVWYDATDDDALGTEVSDSGQISWEPVGTRSISISSNKEEVRKGRAVRISGAIEGSSTCEVGQEVKLRSKRSGSNRRFRLIATTTTDSEGAYSFRVTVNRTKQYKAIAPVAGVCEKAVSPTIKVRAV